MDLFVERFCRVRCFLVSCFLAFALLVHGLHLAAQTTVGPVNVSAMGVVTNTTSIPQPGSGHDYLHDLDETINPANGSLSIRIEAGRPAERGLNFPIYAFLYDSDNQYTVWMQQQNTTACGPDQGCGFDSGYGPGVGVISVVPPRFLDPVLETSEGFGMTTGPNTFAFPSIQTFVYAFGGDNEANCLIRDNYIYEDFFGVRHPLGPVTVQSANSYGTISKDPIENCNQYFGITQANFGGDLQYKAVGAGVALSSGGQLVDAHGDGNAIQEDPNGNSANGTGRTGSYNGVGAIMGYNDSFPSPGTYPVNFPGYANPYIYTTEIISPTYFMGYTDVTPVTDSLCGGGGSEASGTGGSVIKTTPKVQSIQQPDGLSYQFSYDPGYGLISKIVYPTGAWVQYTWGVNANSDAIGWSTPMAGVNSNAEPVVTFSLAQNNFCYFRHDFPVITKRVVSYDGVNPALEQDFSYSTIWSASPMFWSSKQTTVTSKDLLRTGQPSFQTIYNYIPEAVGTVFGSHISTSPLPMEDTVVYKNTSGNVLRTVKKIWNLTLTNESQLLAQCETLPNGAIRGTFYQYAPYTWNPSLPFGGDALLTDQLSDVAEYDFGTGLTSACTRPSSTPTRETATTYASFGNTPLWPTFTSPDGNSETSTESHSPQNMWDRPSTIKVYGNGALISETDFGYDETSIAPVSAAIGHDETNFGPASNYSRGNATTITNKCFVASTSCTNSVTHIAYDETGQPISVTDPNGNVTQRSYADKYTTDDGSPSGNTNTYLTKITQPSTNGVAHIESFQWDFDKGELRTLTDENSQVSHYLYNDPWNRLTETNLPDGGQITTTYSDEGPKPSYTTSELLNSSGTKKTTTNVMDAYGHGIQTQLTTDPAGTDYVDTTYDGLGRVYTVSNPYRSGQSGVLALSQGTTTYSYDALGRKTVQTNQDGSTQTWCYNGVSSGQSGCVANASSKSAASWIDYYDETGRHWQDVSDALGRLLIRQENTVKRHSQRWCL